MKLKVLYINVLLWSYFIFGLTSLVLFYFNRELYEKYYSVDTSLLFLFFMIFAILEGFSSSLKTKLKENEITLNTFDSKFLLFIVSMPFIGFIIAFFEEKYNIIFVFFIFSILFLIRISYDNLNIIKKQKNDLLTLNLYNLEKALNYLEKENSKEVKNKINEDIKEYMQNISKNAS